MIDNRACFGQGFFLEGCGDTIWLRGQKIRARININSPSARALGRTQHIASVLSNFAGLWHECALPWDCKTQFGFLPV